MTTAHITAKIILDSISPDNYRITTFELEFPRFILAEFNTHRMLSRNTASSRAIPVDKMHQLLKTTPAVPVEWGRNQAGMQAGETLDPETEQYAFTTWLEARDSAIRYSQLLQDFGVHKQITNRVTEPFQTVKTVCTATSWANFWELRDNPLAQPEFRTLANNMHQLWLSQQPERLGWGEWHLPYVPYAIAGNHDRVYLDGNTGLSIELLDAIYTSASCCAQVSYRKQDLDLAKARRIYDQLINSKPAHASPVEHQARPISARDIFHPDGTGITHQDLDGRWWSANFCGWIQYRKTIPNNCTW